MTTSNKLILSCLKWEFNLDLTRIIHEKWLLCLLTEAPPSSSTTTACKNLQQRSHDAVQGSLNCLQEVIQTMNIYASFFIRLITNRSHFSPKGCCAGVDGALGWPRFSWTRAWRQSPKAPGCLQKCQPGMEQGLHTLHGWADAGAHNLLQMEI